MKNKFMRVSESKYRRLIDALKKVSALRDKPSLKQVFLAANTADKLLMAIKEGTITEEPTERLLPTHGLYFIIMKDRITHSEIADDRARLPIFRTLREAAVSMERNGWTEENRFYIERIDLVKILNKFYAKSLIQKFKDTADGLEADLSGDY